MKQFMTHLIKIYGFELNSNNKKTYSSNPIIANLEASIQPISNDIMTLSVAGINAMQAVNIYLINTSIIIKNGYKIIDQNNNEYIVKGESEVWNDPNNNLSHQKIIAEKKI